MALKKSGLGRGLEELFEQNKSEDSAGTVILKLSDIEPNRDQPRHSFSEEAIAELADSIAKHGLIQPLLVRPLFEGGYQIVAGERRWRACRMAGVTEVPVIIREMGDSEAMELALIENLQREDLSPIEEAQGYKVLMDSYGMTQEEVSRSVGKSRPVIANSLRLLNLPPEIAEMVNEGVLSSAQARTLLSFKNIDEMQKAAKLASEQQITVRELEKLAKKSNLIEDEQEIKEKPEKEASEKPFFKEAELSLSNFLSRKVKVKSDNKGYGTLEIQFFSEDDLQDLLRYFD